MRDFKLLLILCLIFNLVISCGSDDDDGDSSVDTPPVQREEGPARTGSVVVVNRFNPTIRIINKSVEVNNNEVFFSFDVRNADAVTHQHVVYQGRTCREIMVDRDNDDVIEREEAEEAGGPVVVLDQAQGESYDFEDRVPVSQFPPNQENYVLVIYGAEENANYPVACFPFQLIIEEPPTTTTGGTGGGTTGGTTTGGTTTGGTTGGTTTGGTTGGGPTACLNSSQIQTITAFYNNLASKGFYSGRMFVEPNPVPGGGSRFTGSGDLRFITSDSNSWNVTGGSFTNANPAEGGSVKYTWRADIQEDGCLYINGRKGNFIQASSTTISVQTIQMDHQMTSSGNSLDINEVHATGVRKELQLEAQ